MKHDLSMGLLCPRRGAPTTLIVAIAVVALEAACAPRRLPVRPDPACSAAAGAALHADAHLDTSIERPDITPSARGFTGSLVVSLSHPAPRSDEHGNATIEYRMSTPTEGASGEGSWSTYTHPIRILRSRHIEARRCVDGLAVRCGPVQSATFVDVDTRPAPSSVVETAAGARVGVVRGPMVTALSARLGLSIDVTKRRLVVGVDVPFGVGLGGALSRGEMRAMRRFSCDGSLGMMPIFGNPSAAIRYAQSTHDGAWTFALGGRLAAPVNVGEPSCEALGALSTLALGGGGYDLFEYAGGYLPFAIPLSVEYRASGVRARVDAAPELFAPIFRRARAEEPWRVVLQWAVEVEARAGSEDISFFAGARVQGVHSPSADLGSFTSVWARSTGALGGREQIAAEPFVGLDLGGAWARIGVLTPLDRPLGFGFDERGLYSIRLTLGKRL